MKKIIFVFIILCFTPTLYAELPDKVKVGKYVENSTWTNDYLSKTLLWEILQNPTQPKVLAVEVTAERQPALFGPAAPQIAENVAMYISSAWNEWRTKANYFLPKEYQIPFLHIVNAADENNKEILQENVNIAYPVLINPDWHKDAVGRAGYWEDGSRSSMFLPILRNIEIVFAVKNEAEKAKDEFARQELNHEADVYLGKYQHQAESMVMNQFNISNKAVKKFLPEQNILSWHEYTSDSRLSRILRTVITHEFGHHLGLSHGDAHTIMARYVNERHAATHVTDKDGQRLAVLACYVYNNQPNTNKQKPCEPYQKAHKRK